MNRKRNLNFKNLKRQILFVKEFTLILRRIIATVDVSQLFLRWGSTVRDKSIFTINHHWQLLIISPLKILKYFFPRSTIQYSICVFFLHFFFCIGKNVNCRIDFDLYSEIGNKITDFSKVFIYQLLTKNNILSSELSIKRSVEELYKYIYIDQFPLLLLLYDSFNYF